MSLLTINTNHPSSQNGNLIAFRIYLFFQRLICSSLQYLHHLKEKIVNNIFPLNTRGWRGNLSWNTRKPCYSLSIRSNQCSCWISKENEKKTHIQSYKFKFKYQQKNELTKPYLFNALILYSLREKVFNLLCKFCWA